MGMQPSKMAGMMHGKIDLCMVFQMGVEPNTLKQIGMQPSMMADMMGGKMDPCMMKQMGIETD
eukprot:10771170-Alexandrium_andersonii.AAC.1